MHAFNSFLHNFTGEKFIKNKMMQAGWCPALYTPAVDFSVFHYENKSNKKIALQMLGKGSFPKPRTVIKMSF
jgi:hypothetical protein